MLQLLSDIQYDLRLSVSDGKCMPSSGRYEGTNVAHLVVTTNADYEIFRRKGAVGFICDIEISIKLLRMMDG